MSFSDIHFPAYKELVDLVESGAVLYVRKKFNGNSGVTITAAGITSTNADYNNQLAAAKVGDPTRPFPCIWSAQAKAKELMAIPGNNIKRIGINVAANYTETIGSPTNTQNGDITGNTAVPTEASIKVANVFADFMALSLGQQNIYIYFEYGATIYNICKSYGIPLVTLSSQPSQAFQHDNTALYTTKVSTIYETGILGGGQFIWIYGENQGFSTHFLWAMGYQRLIMHFEAEMVKVNMWETAQFFGYQYLNVNIRKLYTYDNWFFVKADLDWKALGLPKPMLIMNIEDYKRGIGLFEGLAPAEPDFWAGIGINGQLGFDAYVNINHFTLVDYQNTDGSILRVEQSPISDANIHFNVLDLDAKARTGREASNVNAPFQIFKVSGVGNTTASKNNYAHLKFGNVKSSMPFGGIYTSYNVTDSTIIFEVDNFQNNNQYAAPCLKPSVWIQDETSNVKVIFKGKYTQNSAAPVIAFLNNQNAATNDKINYLFKGEFKNNVAGQKVMELGTVTTNNNIGFKDATLVTDGVTESIGASQATQVFMQNVMTNVAPNANITPVGQNPVVTLGIKTYL